MIRLIPRETKFFRMFAEVSQNLTEGARLLQDILKSPANMAKRLDRLQEIEHRGDDMTHSIITTLNQTFITPFDREDIHRLTSSLDDVLDFVNSAGVPPKLRSCRPCASRKSGTRSNRRNNGGWWGLAIELDLQCARLCKMRI